MRNASLIQASATLIALVSLIFAMATGDTDYALITILTVLIALSASVYATLNPKD